MKFVSAITALIAAMAVGTEAARPHKKARVSRRELNHRAKNGLFDKATIMKNAKPHSSAAKKRALGDGMDISGSYSIQFVSCFSMTTSYDDLFEGDDEAGMLMNLFSSGEILALQSYAIFRICYGNSCDANGNEGLLEYVVDLDTYLKSLVNYLPTQMEGFCDACSENAEQCQAQLYGGYGGQYGQDYNNNGNNDNAYRYQNYNAGDNNYNGAQVNNVNYNNANYQYNGGNRKLFQQRVLENNQIVRELDCQLCEQYDCLSDDDNGNQQNMEEAEQWVQELTECKETGIKYQGGYTNNGGQYYNNNQNEDAAELFAGIICNAAGTGVEIGMFYDEDCSLYLPNESFGNYESYAETTYQSMTKEMIEFTFSDAVFSCKEQEVVYTTQDLSNYNGQYGQNYNWDNDDDDVAEWCEDLVSGETSTPVDMATCGVYQNNYGNNYNQAYNQYQNMEEKYQQYQEQYEQYQQQDNANYYQYNYDWYRYEISEDDALDMTEVCKLVKKNEGELHTFYNGNNGNYYTYSGDASMFEDFLDDKKKTSAGAVFGTIAILGLLIGAVAALYMRFYKSGVDDKNVVLIDPDEVETKGGEIA